jgi:hypothetical protein
MPRFRLTQLLQSVTLACIGLGTITYCISPGGFDSSDGVSALLLFCGCVVLSFGSIPIVRQPQIALLFGAGLFFWIIISPVKG